MLKWGVLFLLCMWFMIRMFYVIVILLILFMMPLKVIMREENMVLCISIILSSPLYVENLEVALVLSTHACYYVLL
jgi:hypothetical protein